MAFANSINLEVDSSKIDAALTNFPLRLYLTSASGPDNIDFSDVFTELGDAGRKRLSVMAGATECYVEIVYWDATAGKAILDVRVPSVSASANTPLTLYYDSTEPENTTHVGDTGSTPAQTVWDSNFKAVYHLCKDPGGTAPQIEDATGNGYDLTAGGAMVTADLVDASPFVKAIDFDGSNDRMDHTTGGSNIVATYPITMEHAGLTPSNFDQTNYFGPTLFIGNSTKSNQYYALQTHTGQISFFRYATFIRNNYALEGSLTADEALYAAAVATAAAAGTVYHNRTGLSYTDSAGFPSVTNRITVGAHGDYSAIYRRGLSAEVRISDVERSAAWIKATSDSLLDTLVKAGTVEITEDLATRAPLTDGTVLEDLVDLTSLAAWQTEDLVDLTILGAWQLEDLATRSNIAFRALTDLATRAPLTDGTVLTDLATRLALTDGTALSSLATRAPLIKRAPAYQAVLAQRLRSVKHGA